MKRFLILLLFLTTKALTSTAQSNVFPSGNIGFGTATPKNQLDVSGSVAVGSYIGNTVAPTNSLVVSGSIGIGTPAPHPSSILDILTDGNNPKGILLPRVTAAPKSQIISPANGLLIYQTDDIAGFY